MLVLLGIRMVSSLLLSAIGLDPSMLRDMIFARLWLLFVTTNGRSGQRRRRAVRLARAERLAPLLLRYLLHRRRKLCLPRSSQTKFIRRRKTLLDCATGVAIVRRGAWGQLRAGNISLVGRAMVGMRGGKRCKQNVTRLKTLLNGRCDGSRRGWRCVVVRRHMRR